jgi:integrase
MTEKKINFTKRAIEEIAPASPERKKDYYWDSKTRGLYLCVTAKGVKSFYVRRKIKGHSERLLIGRFPELSVEQARAKAAEFHFGVSVGKNLAQIRRQELDEPTLGEAFLEYMERHVKKTRKTAGAIEKSFYRDFSHWKARKLSSIDDHAVEQLHAEVGQTRGKYAANRAIQLLKAVYNKAIKWKLFMGTNPCLTVARFPEDVRTRILTEEELTRFLAALDQEQNERFKDYVVLSLLTGARKANVLAMCWDDINFGGKTWTIPGEQTKNGKTQVIPLTDWEIDILTRRFEQRRNNYVFYGDGATGHFADPKRQWLKMMEQAKIEDLHIHDLRRSFASWMANTGANISLISSALNHKDIKTTMTVYAHTVKNAERDARNKAHQVMMGYRRA